MRQVKDLISCDSHRLDYMSYHILLSKGRGFDIPKFQNCGINRLKYLFIVINQKFISQQAL